MTSYYVSQTMRRLIRLLIEKGYAVVLHDGKPRDGRHRDCLCNAAIAFVTRPYIKRNTPLFEFEETIEGKGFAAVERHQSAERSIVVVPYETTENAQRLIRSFFEEMSVSETVRFIERQAQNRRHGETSLHTDILNLALCAALQKHIVAKGAEEPLRVRGDFFAITDLPYGTLEIEGRVGRIYGATGKSLTIRNGLGAIGRGSSALPSRPAGSDMPARIVVFGGFNGYKSAIWNKDLEIEIHGDVMDPNVFFYETCVFKRLIVHGTIRATGAVFQYFQGEVVVEKSCKAFIDYLRFKLSKEDAQMVGVDLSKPRFGEGTVILEGRKVVESGRVLDGTIAA